MTARKFPAFRDSEEGKFTPPPEIFPRISNSSYGPGKTTEEYRRMPDTSECNNRDGRRDPLWIQWEQHKKREERRRRKKKKKEGRQKTRKHTVKAGFFDIAMMDRSGNKEREMQRQKSAANVKRARA